MRRMLSTAADMPGPLLITLIALLFTCDAFRLGSTQRVIPLGPPLARLFQDEGQSQLDFIQELVRTKRHSVPELVRVQPHLVHDMGWPEIHETSRSQGKVDTANSSQLNPPSSTNQGQSRSGGDENMDVEDEMERMVHLVAPQDAESFRGPSDSSDPEREPVGGPGAGDASLEASGFYGTDAEDRERGEEGGEDRERRGGDVREEDEEEEERGGERDDHDNREVDALEGNHTTPDLDSLIGYSPPFHLFTSKQPDFSVHTEEQDPGLQEHLAPSVLEVGPLERELWEAEKEDDGHASGYGVLHSSITTPGATPSPTSAADGDSAGTVTPETDTGTDFGLLGSYTKDEETEKEEEEEEEGEEETGLANKGVFTLNPTVPEVGLAPSREPLQPSVEEEEEHKIRTIGPKDKGDELEEDRWRTFEETGIRPILPLTTEPSNTADSTRPSWDWSEKTTPLPVTEVVCLDWSELTERGYVFLNMTQNLNCEEFRVDHGVRLLRILERVFARRMNSPEGSWVLYLSKPTHQQHQLLMNVASEQGVIATKDVLDMLGQIRKSLNKVGIQNYSAAGSCQSTPRQTRSDYGKLFVVLVIIGSVCMVIITSGFIYICWQRRLPATKTNFRAEELHFVENGCHDNPTLDVANDSQPEMQEKKLSANGLAGGGEGGGEDSKRWQVFVNQAATDDDEEEQDTHL
uniref:Podocalyxin like 2 n=1 Tax=Labrus bergylta TaxID=56723 RepID=A0A3Q3EKN6_9LABR|nr:podocalyxin-like protein 2 [Labrus bergylta]